LGSTRKMLNRYRLPCESMVDVAEPIRRIDPVIVGGSTSM
jgi:hypothetical protein